jgi:hypothetical protein
MYLIHVLHDTRAFIKEDPKKQISPCVMLRFDEEWTVVLEG